MATLFIVLALVNMVTSGIPSHPHNSEVAVAIRKGERSDSGETDNIDCFTSVKLTCCVDSV